MSDAVDDDILAAVRALWTAAPPAGYPVGLAPLAQLVGFTPVVGPLPSPQPPVYADLKSEVAKAPDYQTGGKRWDYRKVTITLRGRYPDVVAGLKGVLAVFHANAVLTLPSGAPFLRWRPLDGGAVVAEEKPKKGDQQHRATVSGECWSQRTN